MQTNAFISMPKYNNLQTPNRNNQTLSFKMEPVKVPPEYADRAKLLVDTFATALKDCDTSLFLTTNRKAARDKIPVDIVKAAAEQAQSGKKLLIFG